MLSANILSISNRILAQQMYRKDAKKQGECRRSGAPLSLVFYLLLSTLSLQLSCSSKPTDLRSLVPADTLVYLETNDLGAAIQPIVDSKPFNEVAKYKPDLSAIKGVQLAVAVTGFEMAEEKLSDEQSVGNIRPHFVAVADTHAWNWQAVGFAEKKLGSFVANIYDSEPTLEKSDKNGGKYFTWTTRDGRKVYAVVVDSLIYFGNDESSIEKCLAVKRGETDSVAKAGKVPVSEPGTLASGYVGPEGIAQIANVVGLKLASEASEESEVQRAVASIVPQVLRNTITEVSWAANKTEQGIEDKYLIAMPQDVAKVFNETMVPDGQADQVLFSHLSDVANATRYNLKDPQVAWRSVLLVLQKQTDPFSEQMIGELSKTFFEPYGIRDPEMFLSAVDSNILTANTDVEGDEPFVAATMRDEQKVRNAIVAGLKPSENPTGEGVLFWRTEDDEIEAVFQSSLLIIGSTKGVGSGYSGGRFPGTSPDRKVLEELQQSTASITTIGRDTESASSVADLLSEKGSHDEKKSVTFSTETRFSKTGIERRTASDFGLIGSIIAQMDNE
jgi:hypothetical protein